MSLCPSQLHLCVSQRFTTAFLGLRLVDTFPVADIGMGSTFISEPLINMSYLEHLPLPCMGQVRAVSHPRGPLRTLRSLGDEFCLLETIYIEASAFVSGPVEISTIETELGKQHYTSESAS